MRQPIRAKEQGITHSWTIQRVAPVPPAESRGITPDREIGGTAGGSGGYGHLKSMDLPSPPDWLSY